jgi:CTP:molybdopterin cytidylyltransferase MocA
MITSVSPHLRDANPGEVRRQDVALGVVDPQIAGVLLAAGEGTRLGGPKALVEVAGARLVDRGVALLRDGGTAPVVVVTGAVDVPLLGVITVHNPDWRSGMGSSLAAGLGAVPDSCAAAVIALVDQPLIGPDTVRRLIAAYRCGARIAAACYDGKLRNPVLLARDEWAGVLALATGDVGARPYLHAHPDRVTAVECGDIGRPDDVDTPEDLARVSQVLASAGPAPAPGGADVGAGQGPAAS